MEYDIRPAGEPSVSDADSTVLVTFQEEADSSGAEPPAKSAADHSHDSRETPASVAHETRDGDASSLTLEELESLALSHNPTLTQATAHIQAMEGAAWQAGRYLNPTAGYVAEQMGVNGTAGEFIGGFVSQEFVTAGKLELSQSKYMQRTQLARTNLVRQQWRVVNDVRTQFYRMLAAQQTVQLHKTMLKVAEDDLQTHQEMLNLGQANRADLLRAEIEVRRHRLKLQAARNMASQRWTELMAVVGQADLPQSKLNGTLEPDQANVSWENALAKLLGESPQMTAAWEKIRHDEIAVEREQVEPIPNVLLDLDVGQNLESRDTVATLAIGIELPIFDRNRGTISQAEADLMRSRAEVCRLELDLRRQLAAKFQEYRTSRQHIDEYASNMLPSAEQAWQLLHESYKARRAPWPDVLMAERMLLDLKLEYIMHLQTFRETEVAINGMLLKGGLMQPDGPLSGGHIDAVPKPR